MSDTPTTLTARPTTPYWRECANGSYECFTLENLRGFTTLALEDVVRHESAHSAAMVYVVRHELAKREDKKYDANNITRNPKHAAPFDKKVTDNHDRFKEDLQIVLVAIQDMLVTKNLKYGDSVLNPTACFSRNLTPLDGINIRLDDKIKRLMTGDASEDEDVELDIIGYLIIKRIYIMRSFQQQ